MTSQFSLKKLLHALNANEGRQSFVPEFRGGNLP